MKKIYLSKSKAGSHLDVSLIEKHLGGMDVEVVQWDIQLSSQRNIDERLNSCDILLIVPPKEGDSEFEYCVGRGQYNEYQRFARSASNRNLIVTDVDDYDIFVGELVESELIDEDWQTSYAILQLDSDIEEYSLLEHEEGITAKREKLIAGKWYKNPEWANPEKDFIKLFEDNNPEFKEHIYCGAYRKSQHTDEWDWHECLTEASYEEYGKFLPDDHPDKKIKASTFEEAVIIAEAKRRFPTGTIHGGAQSITTGNISQTFTVKNSEFKFIGDNLYSSIDGRATSGVIYSKSKMKWAVIKSLPSEPNNSTFPSLGTKVKMIGCVSGCKGANGLVGTVTDEPSNAGLISHIDGFNIEPGDGYIWRVNGTWKVVVEKNYVNAINQEQFDFVVDKLNYNLPAAIRTYGSKLCVNLLTESFSYTEGYAMNNYYSFEEWLSINGYESDWNNSNSCKEVTQEYCEKDVKYTQEVYKRISESSEDKPMLACMTLF